MINEHVEFSTRMLCASVEEEDEDDLSLSEFTADLAAGSKMKRNVSFVYPDPPTSSRVKSLRCMKVSTYCNTNLVQNDFGTYC